MWWRAESSESRANPGGDAEDPAGRPRDPDGSCTHPFIPTTVGAFREYRSESERGAGTIRIELLRERIEGRESVLTWGMREDSGPVSEVERRCGPDGAEEPWLVLGSAPGLALDHQTWMLPRRLEPGTTYGGEFEARIGTFGVTIRRTHRVAERERVSVAGERYEALRVEVEERATAASEPVPTTLWIAEGVGLVQMVLGPDEYRTDVTLVRHGGDD